MNDIEEYLDIADKVKEKNPDSTPEAISTMASTIYIQRCRGRENEGNGKPPTFRALRYFIDLLGKAHPDKRDQIDLAIKEKNLIHANGDIISEFIDILKA